MTDNTNSDRAVTDTEVDVARISAYLDAGRTPYDAAIEESPSARRLLTEMEHLRRLGDQLITSEAEALPEPDQNWFADVLSQIARESRSGRDLPLAEGGGRLITEGALRGAVRQAAAERVPGLIIERCGFEGDLDDSESPITVTVRVALVWPTPAPAAAALLRTVIHSVVSEQL
ncbi:MAG: hypothetical protein ACTJHU_10270, partial [Mycetocola sp.]